MKFIATIELELEAATDDEAEVFIDSIAFSIEQRPEVLCVQDPDLWRVTPAVGERPWWLVKAGTNEG